jgi:hypothetical protein
MHSRLRFVMIAAGVTAAAACGEMTGNKSAPTASATLSAAFVTVPTGFMSTENSFDSSAAPIGDGGWFPGAPEGGMGRGPGGPGPGGGLGPMIGGGLGGDFLGGLGLGHDFGHGQFGDDHLDGSNCAFVAATGRVTCAAQNHDGITIVQSVAFTNAAGTAQSAPDSTTNTINTQISVTGSQTRHDSSTTTLSSSSSRTVSGLAKGSTQHTENGTALGTETTNGTDKTGAFVAVRTASDTTSGIIVPVSDTGRTYPIAGTIIRNMSASLTYTGQAAQTSTHREVVTYNGSATANLVITQDGTTRTCTLPLPFGRPTCQ